MKKKSQKTAIIAACITVILLIAGAILIFANQNSYGTMEGLYLKADNGTSLIIDGTSPIQMSDVKNRNLFEGLTDGDRIRIKHDAVLETFPGRTGAYRVTKLADGDRIDIPQEVIDALTDLMWLAAPLDPESAGNMAADMVFDTRLSYVGWTDQDTPWQMAINMSDRLLSSEKALPLMLVNGQKTELTAEQTAFLKSVAGKKVTIIGGVGAVSAEIEEAIEAIMGVEADRIAGQMRHNTSVMIAQKYFDAPDFALITYAKNFPDGLAGGPLAYAMGAPLILTDAGYETIANAYIAEESIENGYVLGGVAAVSDETTRNVFGLDADDEIGEAYFTE